jgi:hypothetical protein
MSTYDHLKARWAAAKLEGDQVSYEDCVLSHVVSASDLVSELHRLANATNDLRFLSAAKAICEYNLVDKKGSWRYDFPQSAINYREICEIMAYELVEFWVILPFCAVLVGGHVELPQVPFERLELLPVLQTHDVLGLNGLLDRDRWH